MILSLNEYRQTLIELDKVLSVLYLYIPVPARATHYRYTSISRNHLSVDKRHTFMSSSCMGTHEIHHLECSQK